LGYTTEFTGRFWLNKPLDEETYSFLVKLNETRRVARKFSPLLTSKYGIEGEFFVDGREEPGDVTVLDYDRPPRTQPSLWCLWAPTEDHNGIEWDGGEKFYEYRKWLKYIIDNVLTPRGYTLSGVVEYQGEDPDDHGWIDASEPLGFESGPTPVQTKLLMEASGPLLLVSPGRRIIWKEN
jgi:hypothetical protein